MFQPIIETSCAVSDRSFWRWISQCQRRKRPWRTPDPWETSPSGAVRCWHLGFSRPFFQWRSGSSVEQKKMAPLLVGRTYIRQKLQKSELKCWLNAGSFDQAISFLWWITNPEQVYLSRVLEVYRPQDAYPLIFRYILFIVVALESLTYVLLFLGRKKSFKPQVWCSQSLYTLSLCIFVGSFHSAYLFNFPFRWICNIMQNLDRY